MTRVLTFLFVFLVSPYGVVHVSQGAVHSSESEAVVKVRKSHINNGSKSAATKNRRVSYDSILALIYGAHNPYAGLQLRPVDLHGWGNHFTLYEKLVQQTRSSLVVEVGVWKGASTCSFAMALRDLGRGGVVVAVDTWLGAIEFWTLQHHGYSFNAADRAARNLRIVNGWPTIFYTFLSNVVHQGVQEYVVPFPATSSLAQQFFRMKGFFVDVIHIDASHEYDDVKADLQGWWDLLRPGGVLLGDDYNHPGFPGVTRAVNEFAATKEVNIEHSAPKWIIWKPNNLTIYR